MSALGKKQRVEAQAWEQIGTEVRASETARRDKSPLREKSPSADKEEDACSDSQLHLDEDAIQIDPTDELVTDARDEDDAAIDSQADKEKELGKKEDTALSLRTNSCDPNHIRSRVFVGHLNTDKCSRTEVEQLFTPYGKITSCSLQQGYGFVQFEEEESARKAIRELHGKNFFGIKLVVDKPVALKKLEGENLHGRKPWPGDEDFLTEAEFFRKRHQLLDELEELERRYIRDHPPLRDSMRYPLSDRFSRKRIIDQPLEQEWSRPPDRLLDRPPLDRYERERGFGLDLMERGRSYDRYLPPPPLHDLYDRPRDDPYEKRLYYDHYGPSSRRL